MEGAMLVFLAMTLMCVSAGGGSNGGGTPGKQDTQTSGGGKKSAGVGVYAFRDSNGNRYEGTYDIDEDDIPNFVYAPQFSQFVGPDFSQGFLGGGDNFLQEFFGKFRFPFAEYKTQVNSFSRSRAVVSFDGEGITTSSGYQNARRENNMNPNQFQDLGQQYARAGMQYAQQFMPDFHSAGANQGQAGASQRQTSNSGSNTDNFQHPAGGNSAFAGGFVGPDGVRQVASISPSNPNKPNIDVSSPGRSGGDPNGGFYSVSSSSYASSSDMGGQKIESRGAKTVVNDNGNIKEYDVKN